MAYVNQVSCVICSKDLFLWETIPSAKHLQLSKLRHSKNQDFVAKLNTVCFLNGKEQKFFSCDNSHKFHATCFYKKVSRDPDSVHVRECPKKYCNELLEPDSKTFVHYFTEFDLIPVLASEHVTQEHEAALLAIADAFSLVHLFHDIPLRVQAALKILERHSTDVKLMCTTVRYFEAPQNNSKLSPNVGGALAAAGRGSHLSGRDLALSVVPIQKEGAKRGKGRGKAQGSSESRSRKEPGPPPDSSDDMEETRSSVTVVKKIHKSNDDSRLVEEKKMQIVKNPGRGNLSFHTSKSKTYTTQDTDKEEQRGTFDYAPHKDGKTRREKNQRKDERAKSSVKAVATHNDEQRQEKSLGSGKGSSAVARQHELQQSVVNVQHMRSSSQPIHQQKKNREKRSASQTSSPAVEKAHVEKAHSSSQGTCKPAVSTNNKLSMQLSSASSFFGSELESGGSVFDGKQPSATTLEHPKEQTDKQDQAHCDNEADKEKEQLFSPSKRIKTAPTRLSTYTRTGKNLKLLASVGINEDKVSSDTDEELQSEAALKLYEPKLPALNAEEVDAELDIQLPVSVTDESLMQELFEAANSAQIDPNIFDV